VAVDALAGDTEEERAVRHGAGVVCEVGDLDRPAPGHLARRESPDEGVELHRQKARETVEAAQPLERPD